MSELREPHDAPEVEPMLNAARDPDGEHEPERLSTEARARILANLRARRPAPAFQASAQASAPARRWSPIGLGLALAACLALLWLVPRLREGEAPGEVHVVAHRNDDPAPRILNLADGTTLWLRQGAEVEELEPRRIRARSGEIVVAAASAKTPFVVESDHGSAAIRGEALVRASDESCVLDVVRGHVDLSQETESKIIARAGEEGRLARGAAPQVAPAPRITALLAWARPLVDEGPRPSALRRGNLLAREPWLRGEWPLPMRDLHVDVVIEDGVARTTIDETFFNPSLRTLEGVYSFPLPADAAISRLAMYVDGKLTEAGVVERQEGRTIYESIVYRRRDPALLEQMSGDEFRIRVFPLPGRQEKRLLLSYVEPLAELYGRQSLRVPLPEIDGAVGSMTVDVRVKGGARASLDSSSHPFQSTIDGEDRVARWSDRDVVLGDDLLLDLKLGAAVEGAGSTGPAGPPAVDAARDGDRWLLRVRPRLGAATGHQARRWVILYDTSASRDAGELAAQERLLGQILRALDPGDRFALVAFDTELREVVALRTVAGADPAAIRALAAAEGKAHVGATDLTEALTRARTILDEAAREGEAPAILYLGDGLSQGPGEDLETQRRALGEVPFFAAALGDNLDRDRLAALADPGGGLVTLVDPGEDMAWRALDLVASIATPRLVGLRVELEGEGGAPLEAATVDPARRSLADGEALLVTAQSEVAPTAVIVRGEVDGQAHEERIPIVAAREGAGYVDPLWARGRVRALIADDAEAHREAITAIGLDNFLVTPFTSLLVVENEAMARQYKLRLPREDGWAHYAAPPTIPVKSEPLGRLGDPPPGVYVMRASLPMIREAARSYAD